MRELRAEDFIDHFVALALGHIDREYPNKPEHVLNDAADLKSPRALHPIFYGSYDWHSCVHAHWLLARALRLFPGLMLNPDVRLRLDESFTPAAVATEVAYLAQPRRETFERPYGWGWLLKLAAEIRAGAAGTPGMNDQMREEFAQWDSTLRPLAEAFEARFLAFLPKATYPIRVSTHKNTAFGLALAMDYAKAAERAVLSALIGTTARRWYSKDAAYQAWEPDGDAFLSPGLVEAECMRRVLPGDEFRAWFDAFLPEFAAGKREPKCLFEPAVVSDRADGQIVHLDGLNFCRAWCWRSIARTLPPSDPRRALAEESARVHLESALPHVTGDYMGEHWLATFALLAMTE